MRPIDTPITRAEHEEFRRRLEAENRRQDKRIELLENQTKEISQLTLSVSDLAHSVKDMCQEQANQSKRLEALEGRDGEMWRKVIGYIIAAVVSAVIGYVAAHVGL